MTRFVVIHSDGKRAACAPSYPGLPFEWKELDLEAFDCLPGRVMTWETNSGASTFASMNGGKARSIIEVMEAAA